MTPSARLVAFATCALSLVACDRRTHVIGVVPAANEDGGVDPKDGPPLLPDVKPPPPPPVSACRGSSAPPPLARRTYAEWFGLVAKALELVALEDLRDDSDLLVHGEPAPREFWSAPPFGAQSTVDLWKRAVLIAERALGPLTSRHPCLTEVVLPPFCADEFLGELLTRVQGPNPPLRKEYVTFFDLITKDAGSKTALYATVLAVILSPEALFVTERGGPGADPGWVWLTEDELAARFSRLFALYATSTDEVAPASALFDAETRVKVARVMLDRKPARQALVEPFRRWWHVDDLSLLRNEPPQALSWSPELPRLMRTETLRFVEWALHDARPSLPTLFTVPATFADGELAAHYGALGPGAMAKDFMMVPLDPRARAGVLTQGLVLAGHSGPTTSSPTARGTYIRETFLCESFPAPPPKPAFQPPEGVTTRAALERALTAQPTCRDGCHERADPVGYALEWFDPTGRFRSLDGGARIDASGSLPGTDVAMAFEGAPGLGKALASSAEVRRCFARRMFEHALARPSAPEDECLIDRLAEVLAAANGDLLAIYPALAGLPEFATRPVPTRAPARAGTTFERWLAGRAVRPSTPGEWARELVLMQLAVAQETATDHLHLEELTRTFKVFETTLPK